MARDTIIWGVLVLGCTAQVLGSATEEHPLEYMSKEDREILKEEARDMFYHAYNAYMDNAYPADELMPLSCKGRYRGSEPDRGDIDSTLGNFSLTLVDTLDTLVVLGDLEEFENAVRLIVEDVKFDTDVIVSLFETNIRMLGGLLSGHILAEYLQLRADIMPWYRGELLDLAKDLGYRFLPAFNTTTGIPFGRINLRHGMKGVPAEMCRETCTACAGSMILEMAALSRLTGESIFEDKAQKAMDALWKMRHRGTDLMGSVLNVHSGDWVRRDSGVGAGIDSYYEYCLKAYILLGDEKYLGRFNKHYQAVMKYVSQGPMLLDVHMHRPNTNSKNFMDALLAFWPGLQVLKGDIKPAVETHEMLYQVMQRHNFIPEAFTTDFQVHWGHHPLRPEFLESTYFLYRATGDHYYLGVGRKVLKSLQTYARVPCGYAAVSDVRTNKHDDTMDSFVLSETFKYLFLLFAEPNDLVLDLDEFIFTTEGHLLPLTLAAVRTNVTADLDRDVVQVGELDRTCPNSLHLFPASVRQPLRNMVEDVCPRRNMKRRLNASQFQANNLEHLKILSNMGITILTLSDGRVQLLHTFSNARTAQDAEEGLLFMQEMVDLSRKQTLTPQTRPQSVTYMRTDTNPPREVVVLAGPAHFGLALREGNRVTGKIEFATPSEACTDLSEPEKLVGKIVMVARGNCMFVEKARRIQKAGAIAGIVLDTVVGSSAAVSPMFAMSGDGKEPDDVKIPVVFLFNKEAAELVVALIANDGSLDVTIGDYSPRDEVQLKAPGDLSVFERLKGSLKDFIIRQITPQNSGITSKPAEAHTTDEDDVDWEERVSVEYAHLKALIFIKGAGLVKIMKSDDRSQPTKVPNKVEKTMNDFEKTWNVIKQGLINDLYASKKAVLFLPIAKIQFQYKMMHKLRGVGGIVMPVEKLSVWILVRWFLRELSEIQPVLASNDDANLFEIKHDDKSNDEKIFEQSLDKADALDLNVLDVINTARKHFDSDKSQLNDESKRDVAGDSTQSSNLAYQLESNRKTEISAQPFFYFDEFKIFLIAELQKTATSETSEKTDSSSSTKIESEKEISLVFENVHLKAEIDKTKSIVKIGITGVIPDSIEQPEKLQIYEESWHDFREYLLAVMYAYVEPEVKIPLEHVVEQYHMVQAFRDYCYEDSITLENIVEWYMKELSDVRIDPNVVSRMINYRVALGLKLETGVKQFLISRVPKYLHLESSQENTEGGARDSAEAVNSADNADSMKKSQVEEKVPKDSDDTEYIVLSRVEKVTKSSSSDENDADDNDENRDTVENRSTKNVESSVTENEQESKITGDTETKKPTDRIDNEATKIEIDQVKNEEITDDEAHKFLVQIEKEDEHKSDNFGDVSSSSARDPLEEFKKPVWAPEEEKESAKPLARFQRKSDTSNTRYDGETDKNFEYPSEYSMKMKSSETKTRHNGKRIVDDL